MDFSLTSDQLDLQDSFGRLFAEHSTSAEVREAEPIGFSADLWHRLVDVGVPTIGMRSESGDAAASLTQLIVIAEEYGRRLAPVPLIETLVTARALDRFDVHLPAGICTIALQPVAADGNAPLLAAGAVSESVVALVHDTLVLADLQGNGLENYVSNLGSSPLANRLLGPSRTVLAEGEAAGVAFDRALDDWKLLVSAALIGVSAEAHRMTVEYVKDRRAFGVPIGWFQTVAHRLADAINELDGARLLIHKAAWAIDTGDQAAARLASMSYAYAMALSERVTAECLHFHGGIGYTREHDIQLYFRRATCWPLALGDPRAELNQVAERIFASVERGA
jgi:alkylation response protein AidB-like acyl-CoA dehydrogenase